MERNQCMLVLSSGHDRWIRTTVLSWGTSDRQSWSLVPHSTSLDVTDVTGDVDAQHFCTVSVLFDHPVFLLQRLRSTLTRARGTVVSPDVTDDVTGHLK